MAKKTKRKMMSVAWTKANVAELKKYSKEKLVWSKYWSEAAISSIEKLVYVDHCSGSSAETRPIAQAKVYGNWLVSSPAVIVVNNASALA